MASYVPEERSVIAAGAEGAVVTLTSPARSRNRLPSSRRDGSSSTSRIAIPGAATPAGTMISQCLLEPNNSIYIPNWMFLLQLFQSTLIQLLKFIFAAQEPRFICINVESSFIGVCNDSYSIPY